MGLSKSTLLFSLCGAAYAVAGCGSEPVALSQFEISNALVGEGIAPEVADCAAGLEIREASMLDLLDAVRLSGFIDDCRESKAGIEKLEAERNELSQLAFAEPKAYGDDVELDLLWDDCEAGIGIACDRLFADSPIGSDYETFGLSCGNRPEVLECAELDEEVEIQPIPEIAVVQTSTTTNQLEEFSVANQAARGN